MAAVADERLERVAEVVGAREGDPCLDPGRRRPREREPSSSICARWTRSCSCSTAGRERGALRTTGSPSTSSCSLPTASTSGGGWSGWPSERVGRPGASRGSGRPRAPCRPPGRRRDCGGLRGADPLRSRSSDGQAAARGRERPGRNRPEARVRARRARRGRCGVPQGASALEEIVRRLFAALDLIGFFTAGRGRRGHGQRDAAGQRSTRPRPSTPISRAASSAPR